MATFKAKTTWSRIEEALFKPQVAAGALGLNITDPTKIEIPKLADIPGVEGHNIIEATRTQVIAHLHNAYDSNRAFCIWGDTGVSKSATVVDFYKQVLKTSGREPVYINGLTRPKGSDLEGTGVSEKPDLKGSGEGITLNSQTDVYNNPGKYFFLADVRVSLLEEIDLKGVPSVHAKTNIQLSYTPPLIYLVSHPEAAGILFFDEVNRTNNTGVKSALLSVFDKKDKRLGNAVMSPKVFPVAAANIGFGFADVAAIDAALKNRGSSAYLNLTIQEWLKYAKEGGDIHPAVIAFIENLPAESLFKGKPGKNASGQYDESEFANILKYPTYRGYELLSDALKSAMKKMQKGDLADDIAVVNEAVREAGTTCGNAFAEEFGKFMRSAASSLSVDQVEKMDLSRSNNIQTSVATCKLNILAYADMFYNDNDKAAEKQLRAWTLQAFRLPPEQISAIWDHIKLECSKQYDKSAKQLPGKIAGFLINELNDAKKSGRVDQETYDQINAKLLAVAGLPPKTP